MQRLTLPTPSPAQRQRSLTWLENWLNQQMGPDYVIQHGGVMEALTVLETTKPEVYRRAMSDLDRAVDALETRENRERRLRHQAMLAEVEFHWTLTNAPALSSSAIASFKRRPQFPSVQEAEDAVNQWVNRIGPGILTLSGPPGVGKTHLALATWRVLAENRIVAYYTEPDIFKTLHQGIKDHQVDDLVTEFSSLPWLIIDDFGISALGDWDRDKIDRIINVRWDNSGELRTLVTTNLLGKDMPARIASRLRDKQRSRVVLIVADDFREHPV